MSVRVQPVVASLGLSFVGGGFVALLIPVSGGTMTLGVALVVALAMASLFGAASANFATSIEDATLVGGLTGALTAGWAWCLGLGTLSVVWASSDFLALEGMTLTEGELGPLVNGMAATVFSLIPVAWLVSVMGSAGLGALTAHLVGPGWEDEPKRLAAATAPLFIAPWLLVGVINAAFELEQTFGPDNLDMAWLVAITLAFGTVGPMLAVGWASFGAATRLCHHSRSVRVVGWLSVVGVVLTLLLTVVLALLVLPSWGLPVALCLPTLGALGGGWLGGRLATGDERLPTFGDGVTEGLLGSVGLALLEVGPSGITCSMSIPVLHLPMFDALNGAGWDAVPTIADRISALRSELYLAAFWRLPILMGVLPIAVVGVAFQRWLGVGPPRQPAHRPDTQPSPWTLEDSSAQRGVGPFQPPRGL